MAEINSAIEDVKEWLHSGFKEKVIGYILLLFVIYGAVFEVVHPFALTDSIHKSWVMQNWWVFQLVISFGITSWLFYLILPSKVLQKFSFYPGDTPLDTCWESKDGNPERSIDDNGLYGKALLFAGNGASDCKITDMVPRGGKSVAIICKPKYDFVLYLLLTVNSNNGTNERQVWVALKSDIITVKKHSDKEWHYPVKPVNLKDSWVRIHVNIKDAVKKTIGQEHYKLNQLVWFRIRGTGSVESITIR